MKFKKPEGALQLVLRYMAEVVIIFLGITISFGFDQWREERQRKKDLTELSQSLLMDIQGLKVKLKNDLGGSEDWIRQLDSLRMQRTSNQLAERQLVWFYKLVTGQNFFLFEPHSPTYLSAVNSSLYSELPDSIKNELYNLYQVRLPFFQLLYNEQQENITTFKSFTFTPSDVYFYHQERTPLQPDLKKMAHEIQRPAYGNFINQVMLTEKEVYKLNERSFELLTVLENNLRSYVGELKGE